MNKKLHMSVRVLTLLVSMGSGLAFAQLAPSDLTEEQGQNGVRNRFLTTRRHGATKWCVDWD